MKEVKEDCLGSDMWAWRKYGQKPIKGSPYPRSYYRCSSSKGCLARKQVERSFPKPEIFIITYTAEHSHAHPVRRNSLAGSTRSKLTASSKHKNNNSSCYPSATGAPSMESIKGEFVNCDEDFLVMQKGSIVTNTERNEIDMMDMMLSHEGLIIPSSSSSEDFVDNKQNLSETDMDREFLDQFFSDGFVDAWFLDQSTNLTSLDDSARGLSTLDRFLNEEEE